LFIDYSYLPSDHKQAEDRIHRIGQTADSVTIYQLYAKNTIDERMREILTEKQKLFDTIFNNKTSNESSGQQSIINDLLKKYDE